MPIDIVKKATHRAKEIDGWGSERVESNIFKSNAESLAWANDKANNLR